MRKPCLADAEAVTCYWMNASIESDSMDRAGGGE